MGQMESYWTWEINFENTTSVSGNFIYLFFDSACHWHSFCYLQL